MLRRRIGADAGLHGRLMPRDLQSRLYTRRRVMNIQVLLAMLGLLSAPAMAQVSTAELRDRQSGGTQLIDAPQGPVNLTWGQNRQLANASDYKVAIADLDQNGDRVLTVAEVPEAHALHSEFRLVDADHDGRITAEELANWR
jgi:hypothetical protein